MTNPKEPSVPATDPIVAKTPEGNPEPENQEKSFSVETGSLAIVDASVLKGIDNPLAKQAVIIPTKFGNAIFQVKTEYDDTILRSVIITPKPSETEPGKIDEPGHATHPQKGTTAEVTPPELAKESVMPPDVRKFEQLLDFVAASYNFSTSEVARKLMEADIRSWDQWKQAVQKYGVPVGLNFPKADPQISEPVASEGNAAPLSHDDTVQRAIRATPRSRQHMKGSDLYRKGSPAKKVLARVRRPSRHQNKPEVEDAFQFIMNNSGKSLTEEQLKSVKDPALLAEAMDLMLAMTFNNWDMVEGGTTNGDYLIEDERFSADNGILLFNNDKLNFAFNWIYETRQKLKKVAFDSAWDISKLVK